MSHRNKSVNLTAMLSPPNQFGACGSDQMTEASSAMKKPAKPKRWRDATIAIHQGAEHFHVGAPVGTTIARTANFTFESTEEMKRWAEGKSKAYIYTRYGNPSLTIAEGKSPRSKEPKPPRHRLRHGRHLPRAARRAQNRRRSHLLAATLRRHVSPDARHFPGFGITVRQVETDLAGIEQLVTPRTKVLYIETPTNPTVRLVDLQKAIAFAKNTT